MSRGSREKHSRPDYSEPACEHLDDEDPMCSQCGFFPKTATRDICECCESMEVPNPGSFK